MGIHCEINLRRPADGAFTAGNLVAGTARYTFDDDIVFTRISITFKGTGHLAVQNMRKSEGLVEDHEEYINENIVVLDDDRGNVLPADCYNTQFCFELPVNVPPTLDLVKSSSNHTVRCKIGYYLRIEFIGPVKKCFRTEINVVPGVSPRLSTEPRIYDKQRKLIQLLRDSFVTLKATIHNPVVAPGEKAELTYEVFNDTNVNFKSVESKLMEYTYLPGNQYDGKFSNEIVSDIKTSGVRSGESQIIDVAVPIPDDVNSIEHSRLVARDYFIKITVYLPLPYRNLNLKIPVQIGNFIEERTVLDNYETQTSWEVVEEEDNVEIL